jgi:hypothetical protein
VCVCVERRHGALMRAVQQLAANAAAPV